MDPPLTVQLVQLLFTIASAPEGAPGVVQLPGAVLPTSVMLLRQPFAERTVA
jgi:hypothetical protein